jgi:hypothetical protein
MCIELNVEENASLESYFYSQNTIGSIQLFALSLSSVISPSVLAHRTSSSRNLHPPCHKVKPTTYLSLDTMIQKYHILDVDGIRLAD